MICCLGVSPNYRRHGVASMLMDEAHRNLDRTKDISVCTFRAVDEFICVKQGNRRSNDFPDISKIKVQSSVIMH